MIPKCEVDGCLEPAAWEGWCRVRDGFGLPTGLLQLCTVCAKHKYVLDREWASRDTEHDDKEIKCFQKK